MNNFWVHNCKEKGLTFTLRGETCNWCDVTEDMVEDSAVKEPYDYLEYPND